MIRTMQNVKVRAEWDDDIEKLELLNVEDNYLMIIY